MKATSHPCGATRIQTFSTRNRKGIAMDKWYPDAAMAADQALRTEVQHG
jgi:hypothetical protein